MFPALVGRFFTIRATWEAQWWLYPKKKKKKKSDKLRIKHSKIQSKNYDIGKEDSFCIHKALNW